MTTDSIFRTWKGISEKEIEDITRNIEECEETLQASKEQDNIVVRSLKNVVPLLRNMLDDYKRIHAKIIADPNDEHHKQLMLQAIENSKKNKTQTSNH